MSYRACLSESGETGRGRFWMKSFAATGETRTGVSAPRLHPYFGRAVAEHFRVTGRPPAEVGSILD